MNRTKYSLKILKSVREVQKKQWDALLAAGSADQRFGAGYSCAVPFLEWTWLYDMEESGSISPETGWQPLHITLWEEDELKAAAPLYLKYGSEGEFVYDYFWAEAASSIGRSWYPKLVGTNPAVPAEGYRFLWAEGMNGEKVTRILLDAAETVCLGNRIPGLHLLFADPAWAAILPDLGFTAWEHSHFLWENNGFGNFEEYLALFNKYQRKNIRKEYRRPGEQGVTVRVINGKDADAELFNKMFELFTITNDKFMPWDARWVNENFFLLLEKNFRHGVAFVEARRAASPAARAGDLIALAMLIRRGDRIWGRYWGAYEDVKDLHFAACYYAPMDWAIQNGIRFFDPGAGSPHKIRRGFRSVPDKSWHKFFDPALEKLFKSNIKAVNRYEQENRKTLNAELPFK
jgi:predicted N-acyltransferase